ncbi:glycosyltransferase family 4 protein [Zavarzinia compransoris]|nr:glycosyltransferase family 4 protein [Zavarzinia compransoris]TDP47283.1 glycosyltransferase involved in cell wall biosynthesis [Zavarzinia compransoris]
MRIAFLTDFLGTMAGTEASICEAACCLRAAGHAVAVVVFPRDEPPHRHWLAVLARAGADVAVLDRADEALAAAEAWRRLAAWRVDIVHAIPMGRFMLSCLAADNRPACPVVATETSEASPRCTWYEPATFPRMAVLDAIVAPCHAVARNLRRHFRYPGRIEVIPHPLRVPEAAIRPLDPARLAQLGRIGSVTRLRVEKGVAFLLAALALPTTPGFCRLSLYGECGEREQTAALIQTLGLGRRVTIAGPFRGAAAMERIHAAHPVMVLSSLFEGLPLALLNAIARGCPVIATDVGGVREIVGDDAAGIVVPRADPTAMSLAIRAIATDPARALACSRAGVEIFRETFHVSRVMARLERFYRDLAG